jgi:hypothetical protein
MTTFYIENVLHCKISLGICAYSLSRKPLILKTILPVLFTKVNNYLRKRKLLLNGNSDEFKTSEYYHRSQTIIYNIP